MKNSKELTQLLTLERIEENIFRGENFKAPWGQVFGGQVLAQAFLLFEQAAFSPDTLVAEADLADFAHFLAQDLEQDFLAPEGETLTNFPLSEQYLTSCKLTLPDLAQVEFW